MNATRAPAAPSRGHDTGWDLFVNLTLRELRTKYRRTALGHGWSLLNPLATMVIFSLVFGALLRVSPPVGDPSGLNSFPLWLLPGLLAWSYFSSATISGMGALLEYESLLKKVYFPRWVIVASKSTSWAVTFCIELGVLAAVLLVFGGRPLIFLPPALLLVALLLLFATGLGMMLSIALVYFRDTQYLMGIVFQFWFYLTTIVYPYTLVVELAAKLEANGPFIFGHPIPVEAIYKLNPMEPFIVAFRNCFYDNRLPDPSVWAFCVGWSALALTVGALVFRRVSPRIVEEL